MDKHRFFVKASICVSYHRIGGNALRTFEIADVFIFSNDEIDRVKGVLVDMFVKFNDGGNSYTADDCYDIEVVLHNINKL